MGNGIATETHRNSPATQNTAIETPGFASESHRIATETRRTASDFRAPRPFRNDKERTPQIVRCYCHLNSIPHRAVRPPAHRRHRQFRKDSRFTFVHDFSSRSGTFPKVRLEGGNISECAAQLRPNAVLFPHAHETRLAPSASG